MKTFLRLLPDLVLLAALCGAGWTAWTLRERVRQLDAEKAELEVSAARQRTENDRLVAEMHRMTEAKSALARDLVSAQAEVRKAREAEDRMRLDRARAEAALREEIGLMRERARTAHDRAKAEADAEIQMKLQAEGLHPSLDNSLRELVDLTDRAPRRAR